MRYFFTVEKYQFLSHLIFIEFTASDKIKIMNSTCILFLHVLYINSADPYTRVKTMCFCYLIIFYEKVLREVNYPDDYNICQSFA